MNSIITRILLSLVAVFCVRAILYLLHRASNSKTNVAKFNTMSKEEQKKKLEQFYANLNASAAEYQAKRAERKVNLESRSVLTRSEREELRIIQSTDEHDEAIKNGYHIDIVSITSQKIKEKQQARHEELVKKNPIFKNAPPAPPFLYRTPNVNRIELEARSRAAANVGTAFVFYKADYNYGSEVKVSYVMVRADIPERWVAFDVMYQHDEDLLSIIQQHYHALELIMPPEGSIVEKVWKPVSKKWGQ